MDWLTQDEIQAVLDQLSADDLIEAMDAGGEGGGPKVAAIAFNQAANRLRGEPESGKWTERIRANDLKYFAGQIREAINIDSPLSDETSELLDSQEPGAAESDPLTFEGSAP